MRYTTLIDISEFTALYRNHNARLVYLHMVLKSGWHDHDRDLLDVSIRNLANNTGLTVSATRHALQLLQRSGLVSRQGTLWNVKKWVIEEKPSPRARTKSQQKQLDLAAERRQSELKREQERAQEEQTRRQNFSNGKTSFMVWFESLIKKAEAGDLDAQRAVERNRATYEQQKKYVEEQTKIEKT